MNQREKVLKGLECCRWSMQNVKPEKWKCDECPYKDTSILNSYTVWQKCVNVLARDAYYLLNGDKLRQLPSEEHQEADHE